MSEQWPAFDLEDTDANPFVQFERWFHDAKPHMAEREAITLVTATNEGLPSARMVLLRHHDEATFGWYTNYESRKGIELASNPHAALLWYCEPLGRQIRIEGEVHKASPLESDAYFATRARGSQLGAIASHQSTALISRAELEARIEELAKVFDGHQVPRPNHWGGYRLTPRRFEFWQHRDDRLHDRIVYFLDETTWRRERQSP